MENTYSFREVESRGKDEEGEEVHGHRGIAGVLPMLNVDEETINIIIAANIRWDNDESGVMAKCSLRLPMQVILGIKLPT